VKCGQACQNNWPKLKRSARKFGKRKLDGYTDRVRAHRAPRRVAASATEEFRYGLIFLRSEFKGRLLTGGVLISAAQEPGAVLFKF
jgi:hypothetical protein